MVLFCIYFISQSHPSMNGRDHLVIVYFTREDISNNGNTKRNVNKVGAMVNTSRTEICSHPLLHYYLSEPPHRFLLPASEGWGKVIFSLCSHLGGGIPVRLMGVSPSQVHVVGTPILPDGSTPPVPGKGVPPPPPMWTSEGGTPT